MIQLPETGFLRLSQIIGNPRAGIPPLIPVSRSHWWQGVRDGRYPSAVKISPAVTCWRCEDIRELIERLGHARGSEK